MVVIVMNFQARKLLSAAEEMVTARIAKIAKTAKIGNCCATASKLVGQNC
jgi:hypothetical protein